jgi:hypothetical protein
MWLSVIFVAWFGVAARTQENKLAVPFYAPMISYLRFVSKLSSNIDLNSSYAVVSCRLGPSNMTNNKLFLATASYPLETLLRYSLLLSNCRIKGLVSLSRSTT